jgi:hydroxypyruvate reductase/glycerate 2-kinase
VKKALQSEESLMSAPKIVVVGAGKAGAEMAVGLEAALVDRLDSVEGLVNVPGETHADLRRIGLIYARPPGVNEPRVEGVRGAEVMIRFLSSAGPNDVAICLLSGGGSALLPAPAEGISLEDKLSVTKLLHRSGATIDEMNCVRKHISRVKGGRLAEAFHGRLLLSLIISDVVGDPLDVIASGPTAPDRTTFRDAIEVLRLYGLWDKIPAAVRELLERGLRGDIPETPKKLPDKIVNRIIGSNRIALDAAAERARHLGYHVLDLGAFIEGETQHVAAAIAGIVRSICRDGVPGKRPCCLLLGGETTVTLASGSGVGGRNQEFALAAFAKLSEQELERVTILSGGTDGEDGPTDAAGGLVDRRTLALINAQGLNPREYLHRHDAYSLLDSTAGLFKTGLTGTNVMDVRVILVH